MADGPDPLGKRALYWMPVEVEAAPTGEHDVGTGADLRTDAAPVNDRRRGERRHARPAGKHALFSAATPVGEDEQTDSIAIDTDPLPSRGRLSVACSSCGSITRIGVFDFLLLQLPFGAWLPRSKFDRWMTCPSCRRRTWLSVTLAR